MDYTAGPIRFALDYLGFLVYATIVGASLPDPELADAAHPRGRRLARTLRGLPPLQVVSHSEPVTPAAAFAPEGERSSNAA